VRLEAPAAAAVDLLVVLLDVAPIEPEAVADVRHLAVSPIGGIGPVGHGHLAEIARGDADQGAVPGLAHRGQQDAYQQGDDRDDHQQFDDRKTLVLWSSHGDASSAADPQNAGHSLPSVSRPRTPSVVRM
jgi:hypothetical protein